MAVNTVTMRNRLATAYGTEGDYAALFTTTLTGAPNYTAGTEVTGGTPAYARKLISWGAAAAGVITGTVTFDVPGAGTNIQAAGIYDSVTGGVFLDGGNLTSQVFSSQGTYTLTLTYTQS